MGMTPQYSHTISTSCAILPTMHVLAFVICVHRRVVVGSGVGIVLHAWVCSTCWCAWRSHVVGGCHLIATEYGRCGLSCKRSCGVHEQLWVCTICWGVSCVANYCCWTGTLVVLYMLKAMEWAVLSALRCVVMQWVWIRHCACRWSFVVCIVDKMPQDVGMVWKYCVFIAISFD